MKITINQIRDLHPCYDPSRYLPRKWDGTLTEMLDFPAPEKDLVWVACGLISEEQQREFARWCALQVIHLWDAPDVVKEFLETGNEDLRDAAVAAAKDKVWVRAWAAAEAEDAARAAAAAAAWDEAWDEARDAAVAAAVAAAWDAARDAAASWEADRDWAADKAVFFRKAIEKLKTYDQ